MIVDDKVWRSKKASKQVRDKFGRFVKVGSVIRYDLNGQPFSGTVTGFSDGKVMVDQKMPDGKIVKNIVPSKLVWALKSKAKLPQTTETDKSNVKKYDSFDEAIHSKEFQDSLESTSVASATRKDGYSVEATASKEKDESNPFLYQLFAPGGTSIGTYADADSLDETADQDASGEEAPASAGPVVASVDRVSRDGEFAIVTTADDKVALLSMTTFDLVDDDYFDQVIAERSWRNGSEDDLGKVNGDVDDYAEDLDDTFDDDHAYFGLSADEYDPEVYAIIRVDYDSNKIDLWSMGEFMAVDSYDLDEYDFSYIIPLNPEDAKQLAIYLDTQFEKVGLDKVQDDEERVLFELADSELDYSMLDMLNDSMVAAGVVPGMPVNNYDAALRSQNAKKQVRGVGGRFAPSGGGSSAPAAPAPKQRVQKATLSEPLQITPDAWNKVLAWVQQPKPSGQFADETPQEPETPTASQAPDAMYFAIVDDADQTAVMDVISIVNQGGVPYVYTRQGGQWVADPQTQAELQGPTPPTVAQIEDENVLKDTLAQIDEYDSQNSAEAAPDTTALAASGYAMPDGTVVILTVDDLDEAVKTFSTTQDILVKSHIRKRAYALGRLDLVPTEWLRFSVAELGELEASKTLYGEFGEIIAAGVPGVADTPSDFKNVERLMNYWAFGKGTAKWRPGTKGDLTRLHNHLVKYVGPGRAWGLAHNIFKRRFGTDNNSYDKSHGMPHKNQHKR